MTMSPERLAITAAAYAADKKGSDIVVVGMRQVEAARYSIKITPAPRKRRV